MSRRSRVDPKVLFLKAETLYNEQSTKAKRKSVLSDLAESGTIEDRISSLALNVSSNKCISSLSQLLDLLHSCRRSTRPSIIAALADVFGSSLLPADSELISFTYRPLSSSTSDSLLIQYYTEDRIKHFYSQFITYLQSFSDPIYHNRQAILNTAFTLAPSSPEQVSSLVHVIATRLSDQDKRLASQAADKLLKLSRMGMLLKKVTVDCVIAIIADTKSGKFVRYHSQLYSVHFLSNVDLDSSKDLALAKSMVDVYTNILSVLLKAAEMDLKEEVEEKQQKQKKRRGKRSKKEVKNQKVNESHEKLIGLDSASRTRLLFLILIGIQKLIEIFGTFMDFFETLKDHFDLLFKLIHTAPMSTISKIFEIIRTSITSSAQNSEDCTAISDRFYRSLYHSITVSLEDSSRSSKFLNLIYQSIRDDPNPVRALSFVHKLVSVAINGSPSLIIGILIVVSEIAKGRPEVFNLILDSEKDILSVLKDRIDDHPSFNQSNLTFDLASRDPRSVGGGCLWGLLLLSRHYHPTVKLFVGNLFNKKFIKYDGDPFKDFCISSFLDKFAVKNPKQIATSDEGEMVRVNLSLGDAGKALRKFFSEHVTVKKNVDRDVDEEIVDFDNCGDDLDSDVEKQLLKAVEEEEEVQKSGSKTVNDDDSDELEEQNSESNEDEGHKYEDLIEMSESETELMDPTGAVVGGFSDVDEEDLIDFSQKTSVDPNVSAFADAAEYEDYMLSEPEEEQPVVKPKRRKGGKNDKKKRRR
ncbi:hypothetical protein P9112_009195 [Eukaryota sp. TZLM1-RC]